MNIVYVVPKLPKGGSKTQSVKAISLKRYEIGCQLLLITNSSPLFCVISPNLVNLLSNTINLFRAHWTIWSKIGA